VPIRGTTVGDRGVDVILDTAKTTTILMMLIMMLIRNEACDYGASRFSILSIF